MPVPPETTCRVCGYDADEIRWASADSPSYAVCDCCGTESGYEDTQLSAVRRARERWVDAGRPWATRQGPPTDWDAQEQSARIPAAWR